MGHFLNTVLRALGASVVNAGIMLTLSTMEELLALIAQYPRFQFCCMAGIASAAFVHMFDIHLFVRILLSIALFVSWVLLGLLLEFLHSRRKKKD